MVMRRRDHRAFRVALRRVLAVRAVVVGHHLDGVAPRVQHGGVDRGAHVVVLQGLVGLADGERARGQDEQEEEHEDGGEAAARRGGRGPAPGHVRAV